VIEILPRMAVNNNNNNNKSIKIIIIIKATEQRVPSG
jgi:hypothetical protein